MGHSTSCGQVRVKMEFILKSQLVLEMCVKKKKKSNFWACWSRDSEPLLSGWSKFLLPNLLTTYSLVGVYMAFAAGRISGGGLNGGRGSAVGCEGGYTACEGFMCSVRVKTKC